MGFWDLMTQETPNNSSQNLSTPYKVYSHYFSPYTTGGKQYSFGSFRNDIKEARNHGLNISSKQAHAMRLLTKHQDDWFNEDGTLREGLSAKDAQRAQKYKAESKSLYNRIKPRAKKKTSTGDPQQIQARWAMNNFIKNGYDTKAASQYATISDAAGVTNLWSGRSEQDYYNSLTAPQKRAYLTQRKEWINNGILKPEEGKTLADLTAVSNSDMQNYVRNNISNWHSIYYGDNGYADEYTSAHPVLDETTKKLYQLYGITPTAPGAATWTPASSVRTTFPKVKINEGKEGGTDLGNKGDQGGDPKLTAQEIEERANMVKSIMNRYLPDETFDVKIDEDGNITINGDPATIEGSTIKVGGYSF